MKRLRFSRAGPKYEPAFFIADRPSVRPGRDTAPRPDYTVREFITGIAPNGGAAPVIQYAWWESRNSRVAIGSAIGILAIGGVWPFFLRMLGGAGFGKKQIAEKTPAN